MKNIVEKKTINVEKTTLKDFKRIWTSVPEQPYLNEWSAAISWAKDLIKKLDTELSKDHHDYNKNLTLIKESIII